MGEPKPVDAVIRHPGHINDEVETIVLKALAKERERRYQSAEALARDVEYFLAGEPIDAKRDSTWYVIRKSLRRHRVAVATAAAFVVLLAAFTIALSRMHQTTRVLEAQEEQRKRTQMTISNLQGDEHPWALIEIHKRGRLMCEVGQLEEAEVLGAEAVRVATAKLGPSHLFRMLALAGHGRTLAAMLRFTQAEAERVEACEGLIETVGADHQRTIKTIRVLVDLYDDWDGAKPAQDYDTKADEWRAKLPPEDRASSLLSLGLKLLEKRAYTKTEAVIEECLAIREEALPAGHWLIFNARSDLGAALSGQGKFTEAGRLLLGAYNSLKTFEP
ncbi:MAG: hypothetical protein IID33_07875, partial [Planctomycetes bacterium]|nr:hypothetical protein [Planctomycetota bacterium]